MNRSHRPALAAWGARAFAGGLCADTNEPPRRSNVPFGLAP